MKPVTYLTNKKILLSLAVVAGAVFLISIGVWIQNGILNGAEQNARMYQTSLQTTSDKELNYSIDTKQGRVLAPVTIKAVDLVKFPEMNKSFPRVHKTEERYTEHERQVCETHYRTETRTRSVTDSKGNSHEETYTVQVPYDVCHQETYYTWDFVDDWSLSAKQVDMAGRDYPIDMFSLGNHDIDAKDIIDGATGQYVIKEADHWLSFNLFNTAEEGDIRYSYDVLELPKSGTVFLNVTEHVQAGSGGRIDLDGRSPKEIVKQAQDAAHTESLIFTIFWAILVLAELLGLGYWVWSYEDY